MDAANTQLRDKTIAHEIYLRRYYSSTSKKVMDLLRVVEKDLVAQLRSLDLDSSMSIKQIDAQLESVRAILNEGYALAGKELIGHMNDAGAYEQEWQIKTVNSIMPVVLNITAVAPAVLFAAIESKPLQGKLIKEWVDKLDADSFSRIQDAVRIGLVEGQSYSDVLKRVTGTKALQYTDGVNSLNNRQAQAIINTAMSHASNTASQEYYQANSDIFSGIQWLATLDGRTCWSGDTLILMANGSQREISKLTEGDFIIGGVSGQPCKVTGNFKTVVSSSVETLYNGALIGRTTHGHKIFTTSGWKKAGELCLSANIQQPKVLHRRFNKPNAQTKGALQQGRKWKLRIKQCVEQIRSTNPFNFARNNRQGRVVQDGNLTYKGIKYACSKWLQYDTWRGGRFIDSRKIQGDGEKILTETKTRPASKTDQKRSSHKIWVESIGIIKGFLRIGSRQGQYEASLGIGVEKECNSFTAKAKNSGNISQNGSSDKGALERHYLQGKHEYSKGKETGGIEGNKPTMGSGEGSKIKQNHAGEMERPRIFRKNEGSPNCCSFHKKKKTGGEKSIASMDSRKKGVSCGKVTVRLGKETTIESGTISGYVVNEETEIWSLSIEGDHSYCAGGLIVHNTPICQARDGKVYTLENALYPPAHVNCRSSTVSVLKSWEAMGLKNPDGRTRASMNGQVAQTETYQTWLAKQPHEFQNEVLGKARANLYRAGTPLDKFVDSSGHTYTLAELKAKEA